jgi:hypothetical protein
MKINVLFHNIVSDNFYLHETCFIDEEFGEDYGNNLILDWAKIFSLADCSLWNYTIYVDPIKFADKENKVYYFAELSADINSIIFEEDLDDFKILKRGDLEKLGINDRIQMPLEQTKSLINVSIENFIKEFDNLVTNHPIGSKWGLSYKNFAEVFTQKAALFSDDPYENPKFLEIVAAQPDDFIFYHQIKGRQCAFQRITKNSLGQKTLTNWAYYIGENLTKNQIKFLIDNQNKKIEESIRLSNELNQQFGFFDKKKIDKAENYYESFSHGFPDAKVVFEFLELVKDQYNLSEKNRQIFEICLKTSNRVEELKKNKIFYGDSRYEN